ncbi:MAG: HD domain-containing protein, partial [Pirellulaceae bacterium]|nr:HD domain-containing protein [Pirellulaceae bacterium]
MTDTTDMTASLLATTSEQIVVSPAETSQDDVSELLARLQDVAPMADENANRTRGLPRENDLAVVRLGMATSLFYCLRTKHASTAAHCLRVALSCSAWAQRLSLPNETRDRLEVAALLHDLGKIGIPDRILRKPSKLSVDEQLIMDCCPELGCEILRGCTGDEELLSIVRYANTWYESRRQNEEPHGGDIPLGSRMLAICNAFDSMTTDHVFRSAMSRERALQELQHGSGSQFDPQLVLDFTRMLEDRPELLQGATANRWLEQLQPESGDSYWTDACKGHSIQPSMLKIRRETRFHTRLLTDLKDGVAFTDAEGTITHWNGMMAKLTGISAEAIVGQSWNLDALNLQNKVFMADDSCP